MKSAAVLILMVFVGVFQGRGQWSSDPTVNTPVCTLSNLQQAPQMIMDANGGTITVWQDTRNGSYDIYGQRLSATGVRRWATDGVGLANTQIDETFPAIAPDGNGGAYVIWGRTGGFSLNLYAQHIDSNGVAQWAANGRIVNDDSIFNALTYSIAGDGAGGAIVAWEQYGSDTNRVHLQRLNASGERQYGSSSIKVTTLASGSPSILGDGSGGAFALFSTSSGQYIQKVGPGGNLLWGSAGLPVSTSKTSGSGAPLLDGVGGIIVAFVDTRNNIQGVFAQRLDSVGHREWNATDVLVCGASGIRYLPSLVSDGTSGAVIVWGDFRNTYQSVYVQKVSSQGAPQWTTDGINVSGTASTSIWKIVSDGSGGATVVWSDNRTGFSDFNLYGQRVTSAGVVQWTSGGTPIATAKNNQNGPSAASDNAGNTVVVFEDERNGGVGFNTDIYAQEISSDGSLGVATGVSETQRQLSFNLEQNFPNPFNPTTRIRYELLHRTSASLVVFNLLGEQVAVLQDGEQEAGTHEVRFDARNLASGVYFYRLQAGNFVQTRRLLLLR